MKLEVSNDLPDPLPESPFPHLPLVVLMAQMVQLIKGVEIGVGGGDDETAELHMLQNLPDQLLGLILAHMLDDLRQDHIHLLPVVAVEKLA
ncbi:hypothetical protein D3C75_1251010 [compost metagenome]